MNFPFLFTSRPLNVSCSLSSALNTPSQWDMVMPPVLWIYDRPEPLALPEGKELYPLISPVQVLSLYTNPLSLSSKIILLHVGLSASSNNFLPIDNPSFTNYLLPLRFDIYPLKNIVFT
jgi:hypothetical protein